MRVLASKLAAGFPPTRADTGSPRPRRLGGGGTERGAGGRNQIQLLLRFHVEMLGRAQRRGPRRCNASRRTWRACRRHVSRRSRLSTPPRLKPPAQPRLLLQSRRAPRQPRHSRLPPRRQRQPLLPRRRRRLRCRIPSRTPRARLRLSPLLHPRLWLQRKPRQSRPRLRTPPRRNPPRHRRPRRKPKSRQVWKSQAQAHP